MTETACGCDEFHVGSARWIEQTVVLIFWFFKAIKKKSPNTTDCQSESEGRLSSPGPASAAHRGIDAENRLNYWNFNLGLVDDNYKRLSRKPFRCCRGSEKSRRLAQWQIVDVQKT